LACLYSSHQIITAVPRQLKLPYWRTISAANLWLTQERDCDFVVIVTPPRFGCCGLMNGNASDFAVGP
jgi:hypothetical protein